MISRIIPTSLIRWVQNLPEWVMFSGVIFVILIVLLIMFLLIRKLGSADNTKSPKKTKAVPPTPPLIPAQKPAAAIPPKPVPAPTPVKPQPVILPQPAPVPQPASQSPAPAVSKPPAQPQSRPQPPQVPAPPPAPAPAPIMFENQPVFDTAIYSKIASLSGNNKTVLFAGAGLEYLPVTIPVQTATKLAAAGKKVLLIDLDTKRNAIAKVFDPDENTVKNCARPRLLSSPVQNLSFWPAEFFVRFGQMNLRMLINSAFAQFDIILINAPYLDGHPDRKLIASCAKNSLIFCKTKQQFDRLQILMTQGECQLLESKPISC